VGTSAIFQASIIDGATLAAVAMLAGAGLLASYCRRFARPEWIRSSR
jgi:hypothetical protein